MKSVSICTMSLICDVQRLKSENEMLKDRVDQIESVIGTEGALIGTQHALHLDGTNKVKTQIRALYNLCRSTFEFRIREDEGAPDA